VSEHAPDQTPQNRVARFVVEAPAAERRRARIHPLIIETLVATAWMTGIGVFVAATYWGLTGLSPWPYVVLSEVAALGFGIVLLALVSPRGRG
jgi:hypothetical protein